MVWFWNERRLDNKWMVMEHHKKMGKNDGISNVWTTWNPESNLSGIIMFLDLECPVFRLNSNPSFSYLDVQEESSASRFSRIATIDFLPRCDATSVSKCCNCSSRSAFSLNGLKVILQTSDDEGLLLSFVKSSAKRWAVNRFPQPLGPSSRPWNQNRN